MEMLKKVRFQITILFIVLLVLFIFITKKHSIFFTSHQSINSKFPNPNPLFYINNAYFLCDNKKLVPAYSLEKESFSKIKNITVSNELLELNDKYTYLFNKISKIPEELFFEYEIHYKEDNYFVFTSKSSQMLSISIITSNEIEKIKIEQKKINLIIRDIKEKHLIQDRTKACIEIDTRFNNRFIIRIIT